MVGSSRNLQIFYQLVIYLCGFLLFWEWLRPLSSISDTGSLTLFVIYTAFCFIISLLRIKWYISVPLKLAGLIFILDGLFISEPLFSSEWFYILEMHIQLNLQVIFDQQWTELTPLFRSLLFLILLWLMSYLLYYWFVIAKRIFLFILLTFIYITVLDTFTAYQADEAIVRTFIISLIAMGMSSFTREMEKESVSLNNFTKYLAWLIPLLVVTILSTAVGFASPKQEPIWPDPVPFITGTADDAGVGGNGEGGKVQKVGYGEDDSRLGGSFVQDYGLVFRAFAEKKHYWRVDSKDTYTGRGWVKSSEIDLQLQTGDNLQLNTFNASEVETTEYNAMVVMEPTSRFEKLVYPYGIETVSTNDNVDYLVDYQHGSISLDTGEDGLKRFEVAYQYPSFSLNQLQQAESDDPESIQDRYLQLPDELPDRVYQLAEEIVADNTTRYDKVMAIEDYFRSNGYIYQIQNVAVPGRGEDYVDQFLFDTKVGYCDNFSTSMAVMLRTLDIPTRWVKGFTGGQLASDQPDLPNQMRVYEITNSNAHSWVEVYFPGVGWVPFEPTNGFNNPVDFYQEVSDSVDSESEEQGVLDEEEIEENEEEQTDENEDETETEEDTDESIAGKGDNNSSNSLWSWLIWTIILLAIAILMYILRYRWMSFMMVKIYRKRQGVDNYHNAYHYLLKLLHHKGYVRRDGQTLRDYAKYVDQQLSTTEMSKLTHYYEQILYSNQENSEQQTYITELWENLIKRSLS